MEPPGLASGQPDDKLRVIRDRHCLWLGRPRITLRSIRATAIRATASLTMQIQHDHIDWSWQGVPVRLGVTRMGAGTTVLMLPALSSIATPAKKRPLQDRPSSPFIAVANYEPGL